MPTRDDSETMTTRACLRKLMAPSSANHMGNVHGGSTLRLCEEAGRIVAMKYSLGPVALVGATRTEFRKPMHVGEVATVSAKLDYASPKGRAMRVSLKVEAERPESGESRRETNSSTMWFSTIDIIEGGKMLPGTRNLHALHPSLVAADAASELAANKSAAAKLPLSSRSPLEFPVVLQVMPDVDAVANHPFVSAGYILKLMDEAGAVAAASHAKRPCVTVLLDNICLRTPIRVGDLCTVRAGVTFVSQRSVEVVVQVWPGYSQGGLGPAGSVCAVEARFIFVALDDEGGVAIVPELPEERRTGRWYAGATMHDERVAERERLKRQMSKL